eukprot:COSAG03_NODE_497_length_7415_cov_2.348004_1_plen_25_part_10
MGLGYAGSAMLGAAGAGCNGRARSE